MGESGQLEKAQNVQLGEEEIVLPRRASDMWLLEQPVSRGK